MSTSPAISARRASLSSNGRTVYPPTTFESPAGSMTALLGASGTGKTSLLLTLAGRMRRWEGNLEVLGVDVAREPGHVRKLVGLGLMAGVNDFAEALTPAQHVTEQRVFVPRAQRSPQADVLALAGIDAVADTQVKHLDAEQRVRLGIALALVRDVRVLVVDDLDRDLDREERERILSLLRELAGGGLTVVFACVDEAAAQAADVVVRLARESAAEATAARRIAAGLEEVPADAVA